MTQDLSRIRAFVQVYEAGGFSAAARQYGRSKALLSKYVTDLENHLGVRLMNRTTRKLSLTEAGHQYYREVNDILRQLDDLDLTITDQSAEARGLVRISAPRNLGETVLSRALFAFLNENPQVSLDLRLEDRRVDLIAEEIDLALRISSMPDSSLIARKITDCPTVLVMSPGMIEEHGKPAHPDDLRGLPFIIDTNTQHQSTLRFEVDGQPQIVHVSGRVTVNSPVSVAEAAAAGLGFAGLPLYVGRDYIDRGELVPVLDEFMRESLSFQAVYPHRRHLPCKVRALIDFLVDWFAETSFQ